MNTLKNFLAIQAPSLIIDAPKGSAAPLFSFFILSPFILIPSFFFLSTTAYDTKVNIPIRSFFFLFPFLYPREKIDQVVRAMITSSSLVLSVEQGGKEEETSFHTPFFLSTKVRPIILIENTTLWYDGTYETGVSVTSLERYSIAMKQTHTSHFGDQMKTY